ncbi:MAG: efflux RND transporter periplasmic adaptor subunit [Acidobacteriota bacterium]
MKAKKRISLAVTLLILAGAGYGAYQYYNKPLKLTYLKATVSRGSVEAVISATGTLAATRLVPVGSRVSGAVVRMFADFNTQVKKGQLLAEIDPEPFQNALEQKQAALRSSETQRLQAQVAERRADVDVRNAQTAIATQKLAVSRAKSTLVEALRKYNLQKVSAEGGFASKDSVETAKATWEQAQLSLESAESQLLSTQASLESTIAQREVTATQKITAESQITQAQGALKDAELNLSFTKIVAPVDGVVITRKANEGETVQASMTTPQMYEIAEDLTEMHLDTNIDESDISRVQLGQVASFNVDAFPGRQFQGEVIQIRRGAVNVQNVISYTVVISVDNSDLRLFPGMTANTRIVVDRIESTLRIPSAALRFRPPAELTVVGDVGGKGGKGKGGKDGGFKDGGDSKATETPAATPAATPTSKAVSKVDQPKAKEAAKETVVAEAETGKGKRGNRNGGNGGDGSGNFGKGGGGKNFDPSQFKGKDGSFDREALRAQFAAKGVDPSQFQQRGGGGGNRGTGGNNGGGNNGGGGFRAGNFGGGAGGNRGGAGKGGADKGGAAGGRAAGNVSVNQTQTVYRLNDMMQLEALRIRTGISDGNFVALLSTNLQEGAELVTAVDGLPVSANANKGGNNQNNFNQGFPGGNNNNRGGGKNFGF